MDGKEPDTSEGEKRYRVLLVEDNAIISELMAELLEGLNCTVSIASDGQEAVEVVSTGEWDIVLMDVFMRGLNGIEATRLIKRNKSLQHLPIVGLTGAGDELQQCLDAGMVEVLVKPVGEDELARCLKEWCEEAL